MDHQLNNATTMAAVIPVLNPLIRTVAVRIGASSVFANEETGFWFQPDAEIPAFQGMP